MFVLGSGVATLNLSAMGDESCSEVSSSSPLTSPGALSPPALVSVGVNVGMSPPTSLASSDIGEVDLDFWDLDLNSPSPPHGMASIASTNALLLNPRAMASPSDTSSLSDSAIPCPLGTFMDRERRCGLALILTQTKQGRCCRPGVRGRSRCGYDYVTFST
ncbi:hypothetical protein E2C01_046788 [Portunus trituberculatus]|uniref:Uncharacterized protein n=1 Tax=Portunus trituberculatus TaxID=210409 RepID=A0A5B7G744_PORTR|nr:hypothetical protein [Portunus trituberculatus]